MLNPNITILSSEPIFHRKASERYLSVRFQYPGKTDFNGWIPIEYRRTGLDLRTKEEIEEYLNQAYVAMDPANWEEWRRAQISFWSSGNKRVTKPFFDVLSTDFDWKCRECTLPANANWARRIQDLKEMGYTIATDTNKFCPRCRRKKSHIMLLPLPRGGAAGNGYETWSPKLRKRIIRVLAEIDIFENVKSSHCLPDHKFPEIRWGKDTLGENPDTMTDEEIIAKFQLLTNQRNQQKREVCRLCYQTGQRGIAYGIPYFYRGGSQWDPSIPREGKEAEKGCIGCPWYDFAKWRQMLNAIIMKSAKNGQKSKA